jgi:hypothetical protein
MAGTKDPVMSLGMSAKGPVLLTQQEREGHTWVLGSTGEGKSRFLLGMMQSDINRLKAEEGLDRNERRSCALLFIDSTPQGANAHQILNYCAQIDYPRVLLIDPYFYHKTKKLPAINPFNYHTSHWTDAADSLYDAFRILFDVDDPAKTSYITKYLKTLFFIFNFTGLTMPDLLPFTVPPDKGVPETFIYQAERARILDMARDRIESETFPKELRNICGKYITDIESALRNMQNFERNFGSTARRMEQAVTNQFLNIIFSHRKGVNFQEMIAEGWVILVNASTDEGLGTLESRLLATVILNEFIASVLRLRRNGFSKPTYVYIDEAELYATDKLVRILDVQRNSKIRLTLSNHFPSQFPYKIEKAVRANANIKVAFYMGNAEDRMDEVKMLFGGDLPDRDVAFTLSSQEKRHAVMKIHKKLSVIAETHEIPDTKPNKEFNHNLFFADADSDFNSEAYVTFEEVEKDRNDRFSGYDSRTPDRGAVPDDRPDTANHGSKTRHRPEKTKETPGTESAGRSPTVQSVDEFFSEIKKNRKAK